MNTFKSLKYACYLSNLSMSVVSNLPPVLFLTFRSLYGISYTMLGLLVVTNFVTQLIVDLIFSFFSHKFNIKKAVKVTPVLTFIGMLIFSVWPYLFSDSVYIGLFLGTIVFSSSGGFVEVLLSPVIAAIPAEDPEKEVSKLHSVYAWGVVGVIILSTLFILIVGKEYWQFLMLAFSIIPFLASVLFLKSQIPDISSPEKLSGVIDLFKNKELWLCGLTIFLGGAIECSMAQWASSYLELALGIPKVWGDIFGVALFGLMLGLGRTLYSNYGKNIEKVLVCCACGALVCYLVAAVSPIPIIGLAACALTGFSASMLWPGCLLVASEKFKSSGVFIFAFMAAGGDLGAAVGPQVIGVMADLAISSQKISDYAIKLSLTPEQFGMKIGLCIGAVFSLVAIPLYFRFYKKSNKKSL